MERKRNIIVSLVLGDKSLPHYEEVLNTKEEVDCLLAYEERERELLGWAAFVKDLTGWLVIACWSKDKEVSRILLKELGMVAKKTGSKGLRIVTSRMNRLRALGKYGFKLGQYVLDKEV